VDFLRSEIRVGNTFAESVGATLKTDILSSTEHAAVSLEELSALKFIPTFFEGSRETSNS